MTLFGKSPDEALARLHRYEAQIQRAWHAALRELRVQQRLRQKQVLLAEREATQVRKIIRLQGIPKVDETKPIATLEPLIPLAVNP
jgi:hypothetical protein